MKHPLPPITTLLIGFLLVTTGMVLAWLLFLRILPSTFFLNFLSYTTSVAGVFLGLVGSAMYVRLNKKNTDK
jgi:energy-coupling factor transporter transmembrane protein EcfT